MTILYFGVHENLALRKYKPNKRMNKSSVAENSTAEDLSYSANLS